MNSEENERKEKYIHKASQDDQQAVFKLEILFHDPSMFNINKNIFSKIHYFCLSL